FLTEPSFLTLEVVNENDDFEVQVIKKAKYFSGPQKIYIDGNWRRIPRTRIEKLDSYGNGVARNLQPVPRGSYTFKLKIEPTYSSYKYFSKEVESELTVD
ncbi:MAG: hypothetical protein ACE5NG_10575, partial [bacterium]